MNVFKEINPGIKSATFAIKGATGQTVFPLTEIHAMLQYKKVVGVSASALAQKTPTNLDSTVTGAYLNLTDRGQNLLNQNLPLDNVAKFCEQRRMYPIDENVNFEYSTLKVFNAAFDNTKAVLITVHYEEPKENC